jgi:hypothetical protein
MVRRLVDQSRSGYSLGYYTPLAIAMILAFIIGNGFMFLVMLVQRVFGYLYLLRTYLWKGINRRVLLPVLKPMLRRPEWNRRPWFQRVSRYVQERSLPTPLGLFEVQRCWHLVVAEVLKRRYKIEARGIDIGWGVWYSILSTLKPEDMRGSILMIAFHAAGWCGIVATHFASALKNHYYIGFCLLLIFSGLRHDWWVVKRLYDPVFGGLLRIRAGLDQLRNTAPEKRGQKLTSETSDDQV